MFMKLSCENPVLKIYSIFVLEYCHEKRSVKPEFIIVCVYRPMTVKFYVLENVKKRSKSKNHLENSHVTVMGNAHTTVN